MTGSGCPTRPDSDTCSLAITMRWPFGSNWKVVMCTCDSDIATRASGVGERLVELCCRHLPDDLSSQIHFLQHGIRPVDLRAC